MAEEKDYQRAMALEREANDARIRELEAENAALKNRLDKYDIPDAEIDKALRVVPEFREGLGKYDSEVGADVEKVCFAVESLAANLKITRAALARKDAALAAADKTLKDGKAVAEIWIPYLGLQGRAISGLVGFVTDVDGARALIAAALPE